MLNGCCKLSMGMGKAWCTPECTTLPMYIGNDNKLFCPSSKRWLGMSPVVPCTRALETVVSHRPMYLLLVFTSKRYGCRQSINRIPNRGVFALATITNEWLRHFHPTIGVGNGSKFRWFGMWHRQNVCWQPYVGPPHTPSFCHGLLNDFRFEPLFSIHLLQTLPLPPNWTAPSISETVCLESCHFGWLFQLTIIRHFKFRGWDITYGTQ